MENKKTQYDKHLTEYRDKLLQRNKEMTTGSDDWLEQLINDEPTTPPAPKQPEQPEPLQRKEEPVSDSYRKIADKLETALQEAGVKTKAAETKAAETKAQPELRTITKQSDVKSEPERQAPVPTESKGPTAKQRAEEERKRLAFKNLEVVDAEDDDLDEDEEDFMEEEGKTASSLLQVFDSFKAGARRVAGGVENYAQDKAAELKAKRKATEQENASETGHDETQNSNGQNTDRPRPSFSRPKLPSVFAGMGRWLIACAVMLAVFILVTVGYIAANKTYKYNQMDIRPIANSDIQVNDETVKQAAEGYTTIALYGVDSRDSKLNAGTNSDAILIVSINDDTKEVKVVSVYRDLLVKIYEDEDNGIGTQKINYAYQLGGAEASINTLNTNLDLFITDYVTVDFEAMADIINALGGVEVTITEDEINNLNKNLAEQIGLSGTYSDGVHEEGTQILNGQQAVAYARIRSTGQGDVTRTMRQRTVLLTLIQKIVSADKTTLANLIDVSFDGISTSFTQDEIDDMAKDAADYHVTGNVGFPFTYSAVSLTDKGSVLAAADLGTNVTALHEYLYGVSGYTPTSALAAVSEELSQETGVVSIGAIDLTAAENASSVRTSESSDGADGTDTSETDTSDSDGIKTLTEPPAGMIENE